MLLLTTIVGIKTSTLDYTGKTLLYDGGGNSLFVLLKRREDRRPSIILNGDRLHHM